MLSKEAALSVGEGEVIRGIKVEVDGDTFMAGRVAQERAGDPGFYKILEDMAELYSKKNTDFAKGGVQGPHGNFIRTSIIKKLYPGFDWASPFGTAMSYLLKQLDAALIMYATRRDSVTGEGIPERMGDVTVYSVILRLIFARERQEKRVELPEVEIHVTADGALVDGVHKLTMALRDELASTEGAHGD